MEWLLARHKREFLILETKDGEVAGLESEWLAIVADWAVNCNMIDTTAIDKRKSASESDV